MSTGFKTMSKYRSTVLMLAIASTGFFSAKALLAQADSLTLRDTTSHEQAASDAATALKGANPPDSLSATNFKTLFSSAKKWANDNDGFITLFAALVAGGWAFFLFRKSRKTKQQPLRKAPDPRSAKERYLDYIVTTHRNLPVAGFETNLRVPIPLEKVYVSLQARMAEIDRARDGRPDFREFQPDRNVTAQEALQFALNKKYDGVVILGQPGAGKTTLAKYFLLCFAANKAEKNLQLAQKFLPILIFLRDVDPEKSCVENILAALQKHRLGLDDKFFLPYLQKGEAILLLDGLDEVPTEEKRRQVSQWIHQQAHLAFPRCPIMVTSRFSGYRGGAVLPGYYLRLEIQDYALEQVKQFLENWLTAVETHVHEDSRYWRNEAKQKAEDLYRRLETTPALRELAVNPLMLQIIALVHRDRGTLPERRIELYKECTDVLLER